VIYLLPSIYSVYPGTVAGKIPASGMKGTQGAVVVVAASPLGLSDLSGRFTCFQTYCPDQSSYQRIEVSVDVVVSVQLMYAGFVRL